MRTITDSTRRAALRAASGERRASPWLFVVLGVALLALLLAL
jgi:hypothetical protein